MVSIKLGGTLTNEAVELEAFPKNYKVVGGAASTKEIELEQTPLTELPSCLQQKDWRNNRSIISW